jgi:hypothetical protein
MVRITGAIFREGGRKDLVFAKRVRHPQGYPAKRVYFQHHFAIRKNHIPAARMQKIKAIQPEGQVGVKGYPQPIVL